MLQTLTRGTNHSLSQSRSLIPAMASIPTTCRLARVRSSHADGVMRVGVCSAGGRFEATAAGLCVLNRWREAHSALSASTATGGRLG